ncbi:hypothetical protein [Pseudosulfitobacter sp. SM2401]|uniref:hypothetical protein n=1 Tax=Pseudosulfitobacter sp. SM2401 TaxID=3350098 RepID=UPI0036F29D3A
MTNISSPWGNPPGSSVTGKNGAAFRYFFTSSQHLQNSCAENAILNHSVLRNLLGIPKRHASDNCFAVIEKPWNMSMAIKPFMWTMPLNNLIQVRRVHTWITGSVMRTPTDAQLKAKAPEAVTDFSEAHPAGALHETIKRIRNVTPTCKGASL